MWNGMLPAGSVVLLEGGEIPLLIVGYCQMRWEEANAGKTPSQITDYVGVPYPMGYTSPDNMIRFDREAIIHVFDIGLLSQDTQRFLPVIEKITAGLKDGSLSVEEARTLFSEYEEEQE